MFTDAFWEIFWVKARGVEHNGSLRVGLHRRSAGPALHVDTLTGLSMEKRGDAGLRAALPFHWPEGCAPHLFHFGVGAGFGA